MREKSSIPQEELWAEERRLAALFKRTRAGNILPSDRENEQFQLDAIDAKRKILGFAPYKLLEVFEKTYPDAEDEAASDVKYTKQPR